MEKHFYGTSLSYFQPRGKTAVFLNRDNVYCVSEEIKEKNVFCIAAKTTKKYQKILHKLYSQITLEECNLGDSFQFAQIMNYEDFFHVALKYGKDMNIIPIYYDKDDKSIQKFVDEKMPENPFFNKLGVIVGWIEYNSDNSSPLIWNGFNKLDRQEFVKDIISAPMYAELRKLNKKE